MGRRAWVPVAALSLLLLGFLGSENAADSLVLTDLTFDRDDEGVYVTMELQGAFTSEVREMLHSGVPLSFEYAIRLRRKRPFWFDKTVLARNIVVNAKLDVLTKEYALSRSMDGSVLEAQASDDATYVMSYLSRLERVKIADPVMLQSDATYDLFAKAKVLDEFVLYVIPWAIETPWQRQSLLEQPNHP